MGTNPAAGGDGVLERLQRAMNDHDVEAFLANVDADYRSEQPAHPERAFGGREQVRENWEDDRGGWGRNSGGHRAHDGGAAAERREFGRARR